MARGSDDAPRKPRFSKSGHTSYPPRSQPGTPRYDQGGGPSSGYSGPQYAPPSPPPPRQRNAAPPSPPPGVPPGQRTYRGATPPAGPPAVTLGKAAVARTQRAAKLVTTKVIDASKKDGADESGLTALIWNQVLSYGTDAMITVALAGTVFFGASTHAQRGNVLLYLLVTMAPFAIVAPIIGPALDRVQHGRRWTMAGTAIGRGILAIIMAGHPTELLFLYPCALGSLVLSKAYGVVRAAAAPRLVPPGMTLSEANARLTGFGLASTLVLGTFVGLVIKVTGSYSAGLWLTAIGFGVCAYFAFRLPPQVDSATDAARHPEERARPRAQHKVPPVTRLRAWAKRGFDARLIIALQGESTLRLLSGLLTIYLAFYIEGTARGFTAAWQLGGIVGAAGAGNFAGTAIGTRLKMHRPEAVIVATVALTAVICLLVAFAFGIFFVFIGMLVASAANSLSKIGLDALIQRDVLETLRSSAFARSETFLQLAWVAGAAIGVLLPSNSKDDGQIGFWVAGSICLLVAVITLLRLRVLRRDHPRGMSRATPASVQHDPPVSPGSVGFDET